MGMFDGLEINVDLLPISTEEKEKLREYNPRWQTKDFDCTLTTVYITDEGSLLISRWEYAEVPKEERPYPNETGTLGLAGSIKRVNQRLEPIDFHGYANFYADVEEEWYEFTAKFTDGKLVQIERVKDL
jgi:hypothetical protein